MYKIDTVFQIIVCEKSKAHYSMPDDTVFYPDWTEKESTLEMLELFSKITKK